MSERRALVVEDSLLILVALEMILEMHGVEIVGTASTVAEALALAETGAADIAILDINLHNQMVYPVADLLIERGVPIVFTTGYAPEEILPARYADIPAIRKPYDHDALMTLVEQAFALAKAHKAKAT
ncbi:response regulator [Propionivibrio sp.]|uniref:response regulator n=1 Tax=Propionivibrio sp. TaxID=2212460 RepID=UPI003BEF5F7D